MFVADTQVHAVPCPQEIADVTIAAARHVRRFGLEPKIALCSHSQFGSLDLKLRAADAGGAGDPRRAGARLPVRGRDAFRRSARPGCARIFPNARFEGPANVLIFANTDAASAVRNVTKMLAAGLRSGRS